MDIRRRGHPWIVWAMAAGWLVIAATPAAGQGDQRICRMPQADNGLIRGDRLPRGCVLVPEPASGERDKGKRHPFIVSGVILFFTPNAKSVVLSNGAALSAGRLVIPAVPVRLPDAERDGTARSRGFGPLERHLGPKASERHFGPLERKFGGRPPTERSTDRRGGGR